MVDEKGFTFGLMLMGIFLLSIMTTIMFSMTKVQDSMKHKKPLNPIYVLLMVYLMLFMVGQRMSEIFMGAVMFILGMMGNLYNYKQKDKYYKLGMLVYTLMVIWGMMIMNNYFNIFYL